MSMELKNVVQGTHARVVREPAPHWVVHAKLLALRSPQSRIELTVVTTVPRWMALMREKESPSRNREELHLVIPIDRFVPDNFVLRPYKFTSRSATAVISPGQGQMSLANLDAVRG